MLLDTYFYHLSRAIPAHECEEIIKYGKSLNPTNAKTVGSKNMLSDEEKKEHTEKIRSSKIIFIKDMWLKQELDSIVQYANKSWGFNLVRAPIHYNLFTLPIEEEKDSLSYTGLTKGFILLE